MPRTELALANKKRQERYYAKLKRIPALEKEVKVLQKEAHGIFERKQKSKAAAAAFIFKHPRPERDEVDLERSTKRNYALRRSRLKHKRQTLKWLEHEKVRLSGLVAHVKELDTRVDNAHKDFDEFFDELKDDDSIFGGVSDSDVSDSEEAYSDDESGS